MKLCKFVRSFLSAVYIPSFQLHIVYPDISDLPVAKLSQRLLKQNLSKLDTTQVRADPNLTPQPCEGRGGELFPSPCRRGVGGEVNSFCLYRNSIGFLKFFLLTFIPKSSLIFLHNFEPASLKYCSDQEGLVLISL